MNAERLHAVAVAISRELAETNSATLLTQLHDALRRLAADPADASAQQDASTLRQQLDQALSQAPSNDFSPAWRQAIGELGIDDLLGEALRSQVAEVLARNEITPSAAEEDLGPLARRLELLNTALTELLSAYGFLAVGAEELEPGEFEIGFLIPRHAVENALEGLGRELVELDRVLGPLQEIAERGRADLEVRTISSSSFQIFLASSGALALCLAKALESLVASYEKIVNIRLAHEQLKKSDVPDEALAGIGRYAQEAMAAAVQDLVEELLSEFGDVNEPRTNELRTELRRSLNAIANRIDRGYQVEVRTGDVPVADEADAGDVSRQAADAIRARQRALRFMNVSGRPILELPERPGDEDGVK